MWPSSARRAAGSPRQGAPPAVADRSASARPTSPMPTAISSPAPWGRSAIVTRPELQRHALPMNETSSEIPAHADWLGRTTQLDDVIGAAPVKAMSATLDRDDPLPETGQALPPLWHWLYFLPCERQSEIGAD